MRVASASSTPDELVAGGLARRDDAGRPAQRGAGRRAEEGALDRAVHLGLGEERGVVDRDDDRDAAAQRHRVVRRVQDVGADLRGHERQAGLLPRQPGRAVRDRRRAPATTSARRAIRRSARRRSAGRRSRGRRRRRRARRAGRRRSARRRRGPPGRRWRRRARAGQGGRSGRAPRSAVRADGRGLGARRPSACHPTPRRPPDGRHASTGVRPSG